jgi:4-amino-4-deoxy-L-arabinose transferase-like glycosyltransferase
MKQSTKIWLLAGIVILASFFRLYHITTTPPGLYPDEAMDGNNALEVMQTGHFHVFYTEDNGREGLYVNILVFFIKALGNKPWVVRLPAAIAGILTVLGLYFLAAELFVDEVGLLAAFLLAACFWHINFSRIGFRAILAPLCLTWATYWLLKTYKSAQRGRYIIYATLAGIVFAAGFYTYIAYRVAPLLLLLFIPFFAKKYSDFWKKTLLFVLVTFVVALPIGIYFLQHPGDFFGRTSEISVTNSGSPLRDLAVNIAKTALMFDFHGDNNWRQNVSGAPELWWPVGILFIIGIILGIYWLWKHPRKKREKNTISIAPKTSLTFGLLLTFSWFLLAGLPAVMSDEGIPHALRSILMLPPAIILAALGGIWLYGFLRQYWNKNLVNILAVIFLASVAVFAYVDYFVIWAQNPNVPGSFNANYVAIGNEINALPQSTQKYVVVNAGGVLARGIPVPAETVMFVTDSFTTSTQISNHIMYLLPDQANQIPAGTPSSTIFYVN